ncbi:1342_t:CDS:2 [Paraglomus occultum]|uniref:1342_t:CDS:1 n=1 Tax=Paraglomus occultum TaxID=144539 RepID=A0A9N9AX13_9GLOM|nr:1342_t:CDS:2 [Paraglomus occultum]
MNPSTTQSAPYDTSTSTTAAQTDVETILTNMSSPTYSTREVSSSSLLSSTDPAPTSSLVTSGTDGNQCLSISVGIRIILYIGSIALLILFLFVMRLLSIGKNDENTPSYFQLYLACMSCGNNYVGNRDSEVSYDKNVESTVNNC